MIKKILKISLFFLILGMLILPGFVLAEECEEGEYKLERPILGFSCAGGPADYIVGIYPYALGLSVFLAAFMFVYAGVVYTLARDDKTKIENSKKKMYAALGGIALILGAILGLNIINPDLADPKKWQDSISIKEIPKLPEDPSSKCFVKANNLQNCMSNPECRSKPSNCIKPTGDYEKICITNTETGESNCKNFHIYAGDCGSLKTSYEKCSFGF